MGTLTNVQEIRQTCLSEAIRSTIMSNGLPDHTAEILKTAKAYENFITMGQLPKARKAK